MTDSEINKAILKHLGWAFKEDPVFDKENEGWLNPENFAMDPEGGMVCLEDLPNHCNDLNAMHEAEKNLDEDQQYVYEEELLKMKYPDWSIKVTHAKAHQRAEAFLKTIGRWEE